MTSLKSKNDPLEIDLKRAVTPLLDVLWAEHGPGGTQGHPDGTFQMLGTQGIETVYIELKRYRDTPFRPGQVKCIKQLMANGASVYFCYMDKSRYPVNCPSMERIISFDKSRRAITSGLTRYLSDDPVKASPRRRKKF